METKSKLLFIGATGYLGKYMVKRSVSMVHPTYVYVRPITGATPSSRVDLLREFESMGVHVLQGELDDHDKLVDAAKQVDVVISTLAAPQYLDQLKIINAIKVAGNIKRFVPSEFGVEVDRVSALPPLQSLLDNKKIVRTATEKEGIPHTYITANTFAAYFIEILLHPHEQRDEIIVYGSGEAKVALNCEEDIAAYTIMAATDSRTCNRIVFLMPPENIMSQLQLISLWEKKTGRTLKKKHLPEEEAVRLSETLPHPDNIPISISHNFFIMGGQTSFQLNQDDLEASTLYPDYKHTSVDHLLSVYATDPPKSNLSSFPS